MDATHVATAGVQPGKPSKVRMFADRVEKIRSLRLLRRLVTDLEAQENVNPVALGLHRQARDRLARELAAGGAA